MLLLGMVEKLVQQKGLRLESPLKTLLLGKIDLTDISLGLESIIDMMTSTERTPAKRQSRRRKEKTPDDIAEAFVACPRCGFFLAGYRLIHDDYAEAVGKSNGKILDLTWDNATRTLVQKSYGCHIHQDAYHYEGTCQDCRRTFVYKAPATRRIQESFQIEISPG